MKNKRGMFGLFAIMMLLAVFASGCTQPMDQAGDLSLKSVKDSGKLIVGTFGDIPSMTFHDASGNLVGFDIDLAKEIASKIGIAAEFREMSFPNMFSSVKSGDVDILVSSITITQERSQQMLFSAPYFDGGQVIYTRSETAAIKTPGDLNNKKVGVLNGTTGEKAVLAIEGIDPSMVTSYDGSDTITQDLVNGKIDAGVQDYVGVVGVVKSNPTLKIVGEPFTQEYYGVVTKLGNGALMDKIDNIISEMKMSGRLQEIKDKWFK